MICINVQTEKKKLAIILGLLKSQLIFPNSIITGTNATIIEYPTEITTLCVVFINFNFFDKNTGHIKKPTSNKVISSVFIKNHLSLILKSTYFVKFKIIAWEYIIKKIGANTQINFICIKILGKKWNKNTIIGKIKK